MGSRYNRKLSDDTQPSQRYFCPYPGCKRSFLELWRLKVHCKAAPDIRGSGKERGHGRQLTACPRCYTKLRPGTHHVVCKNLTDPSLDPMAICFGDSEAPPETPLKGASTDRKTPTPSPTAADEGDDASVPVSPRSDHPGLPVPDLHLGFSKPLAEQSSPHRHRAGGCHAESDEAMATALQLLRSGDGGCHRPAAEGNATGAALLERHAADCCLEQCPDTLDAVSGRTWPYASSPFERATPPGRDVALPLRSGSPEDIFGGPADGAGAADPNSSLDSALGSPLAGGSPVADQLWAAPVTSRPLAQHIRPLHRGARARTLSGPLSLQWEEAADEPQHSVRHQGSGVPASDEGCGARSPAESWGTNLSPAMLQGVGHTLAARRARSMGLLDAESLFPGRHSFRSCSYKSLSASSRTSLKAASGGGAGYSRGAMRHSRSAMQLHNDRHVDPLMPSGGEGGHMQWSPLKAEPEVLQNFAPSWALHEAGPSQSLARASQCGGDSYNEHPAAAAFGQLELAAVVAGSQSPGPATKLDTGSLAEHAIPEGGSLHLGGWARADGLGLMPQHGGRQLHEHASCTYPPLSVGPGLAAMISQGFMPAAHHLPNPFGPAPAGGSIATELAAYASRHSSPGPGGYGHTSEQSPHTLFGWPSSDGDAAPGSGREAGRKSRLSSESRSPQVSMHSSSGTDLGALDSPCSLRHGGSSSDSLTAHHCQVPRPDIAAQLIHDDDAQQLGCAVEALVAGEQALVEEESFRPARRQRIGEPDSVASSVPPSADEDLIDYITTGPHIGGDAAGERYPSLVNLNY